MMMRACLVSVLLLSATLPLMAEEVVLEYCKDPGPYDHSFIGRVPNLMGGAGWLNGKDFLSKRAMTFGIECSLAQGTVCMLPFTIDYETPHSKRPCFLYVDANLNDTIDEGERYPLKILVGGKHLMDGREAILQGNMIAEKIRFMPTIEGRQQELFANVVLSGSSYSLQEARYHLFSLEAWGCCRGRATIEGTTYDIFLRDRNANGLFSDFDKGTWITTLHSADTVAVVPEGSPVTHGQPLRRNIILDGRAFTLDVRENGRKLLIEPRSVEFGEVAAADKEIKMSLWSVDWGLFTIAPGESMKLPAGRWCITEFDRKNAETGARCRYKSSGKLTTDVAGGNNNVVELDTILRAVVSSKKRDGGIRLSLDMTTSQEATFRSYQAPRSKDDPFKGIPFMITNGAGEVVAQDFFEFG